MPKSDFDILEAFIQIVCRRIAETKANALSASEDIMHVLNGWDRGLAQEFVPEMKTQMKDGRQTMPKGNVYAG